MCIYIYYVYIYVCVHTSGICTPRPESQPEELQHRPPRAVRTSSPAPGGPGVDFYSFTLVMYNVYVYVYTYTYMIYIENSIYKMIQISILRYRYMMIYVCMCDLCESDH